MAHFFAVTDGSTTFSLTTTNAMLVNYEMATPREGSGEETVVDTVDLLITGANGAAVQNAVRSLNQLLDAAQRRQRTKVGERVFVTAQLDSDGSSWRSEIVNARLELSGNSLSVWANFKFEAKLFIERRPWWEGARTQIPLTNGNGTNNTSGLTVWNHDDGDTGHDNYVQIAAANVAGDLPAPLEVQLTNNNGAARAWSSYWLAVNQFNDPGNFGHIIEGESRVTGYGTVTTDSNSSGGNYNLITSSGIFYMYWDLSAALVSDCAGYPFRLLVRFATSPPNGWVTPLITMTTVTAVLEVGQEVEISSSMSELVDLGVLHIPPAAFATNFGALRLGLRFRLGTSQPADVDFIQLTPAQSCRNVYQRGLSMANNEVLVVDEIEEQIYSIASALYYPYFIPYGTPLMVMPNRLQRLYFLVSRQTGSHVIADTVSARVWYRPRRATV